MVPTLFSSFKGNSFGKDFLKIRFLFQLVLFLSFSFFLVSLFKNPTSAQWGAPLELSGRTDLLTGLGPGIGQLTNEDGTPMTEEQWKAKIEEYVESIAGMDLTEEQVVSGFYDFLGIESVSADPTSPEYAALSSGLTGARTGDKDASRALAESIAAAAQAATENPVSGDPAAPVAGDQPTADPGKEGTVGPKKDGENPGVAPEGLETNDPTKSSADYVDGNPKDEPSDNNQNPLDSSEDQTQDPSQEETNQPPAKTETENFRKFSEGLTL